MFILKRYFGFILLSIVLLTACQKQNELFTTSALKDYYPLQVGKYITYNLDSTVFINFGKRDTVIKYQAKDSIDAQITDNTGRPAFRIIRLIRKDASKSWSPNNTFLAVPTETSIEFIENNLRFIKLVLPIRNDYTWKGNSYLTIDPYPSYGFSSAFMDGWDYAYKNVNTPLTIGTYNLENTITVLQRNDSLGDPKTPGTLYAEKTFSIEKYAKDIGLVYKEFIHWEYQGNTKSFKGFGIKLTMIDHN